MVAGQEAMLKFSVLLPTRNRLDLLKLALHSILNQDYEHWEVIVSDNCSEEDVASYIHSLGESRIKYFRTPACVSVTQNWNYALEKSSGDYLIMLGDDDALMQGYFRTILHLIERFQQPDFIYTSGFLYAYPGVIPGHPNGFLRAFGNASFLEFKREPFLLSREEALYLVRQTMNFKVMFTYNMQYAIFNRQLMDKIRRRGEFFQSPYPDYYAMTALMLNAERILAYPFPIVAVGISPKSFGFYYYNQREKEGVAFLNHREETPKTVESILLPGTEMNTSWLFALEAVKQSHAGEMKWEINYDKYRLLQIVHTYKQYTLDRCHNVLQLEELWKKMRWNEKLLSGVLLHPLSALLRCLRGELRRKAVHSFLSLIRSHPRYHHKTIEASFPSMRQVFEHIDPTHYRP